MLRDGNIPTLKALIAFETTIRLGSMTAAARELGNTQSAVSQQIRLLEDAIGEVLFDRSGNRLTVTGTGLQFYGEISPSLKTIEEAVGRLRGRAKSRSRKLVIAAHFGFAYLWLQPRLAELERCFPDFSFEVSFVDQDDSNEMEEADLAVRFGRFEGTSIYERLLIDESVSPVCSPDFARAHSLGANGLVERSETLPLLHMGARDARWMDWELWGELAKVRLPLASNKIRYNNYPLLLGAAKDGLGLALGWSILVQRAVRAGELVRVGPAVERQDHGYIIQSRFIGNASIEPVIKWFFQAMKS